jgi:hypothetical protein
MDYDLMCRIANEPYGYINETIAIFDDSGISTKNYLAIIKRQYCHLRTLFWLFLKMQNLAITITHFALVIANELWGNGCLKLKKGIGFSQCIKCLRLYCRPACFVHSM